MWPRLANAMITSSCNFRLFLLCWYVLVLLHGLYGYEPIISRSIQRLTSKVSLRERAPVHVGVHVGDSVNSPGGVSSDRDSENVGGGSGLRHYASFVKNNVLLSHVVSHYTRQRLSSSSQQFCLCPLHDDRRVTKTGRLAAIVPVAPAATRHR